MIHPLFQMELPPGWRLTTVDGIKAPEKHSCVAGPFGSSISSKYFAPEGVPVIRGNNLKDDLTRFVPTDFAFVTPERAQKYRAQYVRAGDLVFTCWGTIGQIGLIPPDGPYAEYIISNKQLKLRIDRRQADPTYLFYYFACPDMVSLIRSRAIGSAVPGINLGILKALPVALPPLELQKTIAARLSAYDDLVENNVRRIRILEEMGRALFREWFVDLRFPGHQPATVAGEHGVPKGWRIVKLAEVAQVNRAQIHTKTAPERILYIDISSVGTGTIREVSSLAFTDAPGRARRVVQHGDILWSCVRPNRRSHVLILNPEANTVASTGFAVLTARRVPYTFLYHATTTDAFVSYLTNHATGAAYPAVTATTFENADLPLPPAALLERFAKITVPQAELVAVLQHQNANLRTTRDLLLPRLLSGQLSIGDAERHLAPMADAAVAR